MFCGPYILRTGNKTLRGGIFVYWYLRLIEGRHVVMVVPYVLFLPVEESHGLSPHEGEVSRSRGSTVHVTLSYCVFT